MAVGEWLTVHIHVRVSGGWETERELHLVLSPALVITGSRSFVQKCQLSMLGREEPPCWEAPAAVCQKELEVSGQLVSFPPT